MRPFSRWLSRRARLALGWVLWKLSSRSERGGLVIGIVEGVADAEASADRIATALSLIQDNDPVLYRRLQFHLPRIVVLPRGRASYWHAFQVCMLSSPDIMKWHVSQLASIIVHEGMHAWIRARGIDSGSGGITRNRIEQTCLKGQLRFARQLVNSDDMIKALTKQHEDLG